jgi:hypothetical protein
MVGEFKVKLIEQNRGTGYHPVESSKMTTVASAESFLNATVVQ